MKRQLQKVFSFRETPKSDNPDANGLLRRTVWISRKYPW
jgi:hypothetical protein